MTPNRSALLTSGFLQFKNHPNLNLLQKYLPLDLIEEYEKGSNRRNRVFSSSTTIILMILSAMLEDKSLTNIVSKYSQIHESEGEYIEKELSEKGIKSRRGLKSKLKDISLSSSAYSQARTRLSLDILKEVYRRTTTCDSHKGNFNGMPVYIADGTYFNLQDTPELKEKYAIKGDYSTKSQYPQILVEVILKKGSGKITDYSFSNRSVSELEHVYGLIDNIPQGSLLVADALYSSFAIFSKTRQRGIKIIVPEKRGRNYEAVKDIAEGDQIVRIKSTKKIPKWLPRETVLPEELLIRRIEIKDIIDETKKHILYTDIFDEGISKEKIFLEYYSRWDVEVSIREIKKIMNLDHLRSKSEDMINKEIITTLIAYNIVREIIAESVDEDAFPPSEDIFQAILGSDRKVLIDKKGRIYERWSPGRYGRNKKENPDKDKKADRPS